MKYIIEDTEGSGLFDFNKDADAAGQPRLASIGLILVDENFVVEETHEHLIKPDGWTFDNNSEAAAINGLTHERLMDEGVPVRDVLRIYGSAIDDRRVVIGFNVLHDLKQLRAELRRAGYPDRFMQTRYICAMQGCRKIVDARGVKGQKKAPRLEEACKYFGIDQQSAHGAFSDARDVLEIMLKLRERGAMPEFTDPYNREPKKPSPARHRGRETNLDQQDFIGGANADEK